jgi:dynein heavy chain
LSGFLIIPKPYTLQPVLQKEGGKIMQVNFSKNLAQIIREIKYLDAMGFHLPEFALSVTLQEDKYDLDAESLENMLKVCTIEVL